MLNKNQQISPRWWERFGK